jgi:hypothetical protein
MTYLGPAARPRRRRGRIGCLGALVLIVLIPTALAVFFAPWAEHIGGRFTPLGYWSGIGKAHAPDGTDFGVALNLKLRTSPSCSRLSGKCSNLQGNAVVCTRAGRYTFSNLDGTLDGYWSTDGHAMTISFTHGNTTLTRYVSVILKGTWHGPAYQATDGGYLVRGFNSDGSPRSAVTSPDPAQAASVTIQPGDFAALCRGLGFPT